MTDFIDVLEQQLVAAHSRPARRQFVAVPWRATIVFAGAVATAAVIVIAVLALSSPEPHRAASPPARRSAPAPATAENRPTLAVLNGTTVTGLARVAADELTSNGYPEPNVVTNDTTNQTRPVSTVYYEPGHKVDAQGVAACLRIGYEHVAHMDANARALADRADVAVFIGADRAR
jgi:hypothetical protein